MNKDMNVNVEVDVYEEGSICPCCYCAYTVDASTTDVCPECETKGLRPDYLDAYEG